MRRKDPSSFSRPKGGKEMNEKEGLIVQEERYDLGQPVPMRRKDPSSFSSVQRW